MQLGRTRNRNDPRLLRQQPGQRDLGRRHLLLFCELANQVHYSLIRLPVFRSKSRNYVAEVRLVELRVFADFAGEETLAQRAEWNEADTEFLERRHHFSFRL